MEKIIIILLLSILTGLPAFASYISLETRISAKAENNNLKVTVSVTNRGDETAYNVQAEAGAGDQKVLLEKKDALGVGEEYQGSAEFNLDSLAKPGTYPLQVTMYYADANQYPFSALHFQTFSYKAQPSPSQIFGMMNTAVFWREGGITLSLKNLGDSAAAVSSRLMVSRELSVDRDNYTVNLAPKSEAKVNFKLKNFSALAGSAYSVFAITEYEKDGIHMTSITPAVVKIIKEETANWFLGGSAILLSGLIILLIIYFTKKKKTV